MVMLSPTEQLVLSLLRERATTLLGAELVKLVLFGSRARGHGHEESDLDVLVLLRTPDLATDLATRQAVQDIAADLTFEYGIRVSPLIRDASFQWGGTLGKEIERDGVEL